MLPPSLRPEFDTIDQRWRWWSSHDHTPSIEEDRARAVSIDVVWSVKKDGIGGRCWDGIFDQLPGFAPLLWNVHQGEMFLRRPEGVWKAPLPKWVAKDYFLMKEMAHQLPELSGGSTVVLPEFEDHGWHNSASTYGLSLDDVDQEIMAGGWIEYVPVLLNTPLPFRQRWGHECTLLRIDGWCDKGPMQFRTSNVRIGDQERLSLVMMLANGVVVAEPIDSSFLVRENLKLGKVQAYLGNDHFSSEKQPVILASVA